MLCELNFCGVLEVSGFLVRHDRIAGLLADAADHRRHPATDDPHTESVGESWSEDGYELLLSAIGCSAVWRTVGPPARRAMGTTGR